MSAKATISGVLSTPDTTQKQLFIDFTVTLTGNYGGGATNGDTLDLTALGDALKSTQLPNWVEFGEYPPAGTAPTGYQFGYAPGTTQANGVLTIMGAAGTPSGTIGAQTLTIGAGTPATYPVGTAANTGSTTLVATAGVTVTGISTAVFTGTAPASGSSQYPEGSAYSAALLAAVIRGRAWFPCEI